MSKIDNRTDTNWPVNRIIKDDGFYFHQNKKLIEVNDQNNIVN